MKRINIFFLIATFFSLFTTQAQCDLFFSEYAEGSSNNKYLEIFNPTNADISLDGYAFPSVSNAPTTPGELEYWNTFTPGAIVPAGGFYIVSHGSADPSILALANQNHTYLSNGDDGYALVQGIETDFVVLDVIGQNITDLDYADPGSGWDVAGVTEATKDHVLVRKPSVINGNTDWALSAGTDEASSEWIVMPIDTWTDLGIHTFTGSCGPVVSGCTNENATNYDATANEDDGSCTFANACNLEGTEVAASSFAFVPADLTVDIGTLVFWVNNGGTHDVNGAIDTQTGLSFENPESFGLASVFGDAAGVCIGSHTFTIPGVYSYDCSIGSHAALGMVGTITVGVGGCTDAVAPNYNEAADFDDGSCVASPYTLIADIQIGQETALFEGVAVLTSGIVTGVYGGRATIQDGAGAYSGIWIDGSNVALQVGDAVDVSATVAENFGLTQLTSPSVTINSQGNALPASEVLSTLDVSAEQWEGVLVQTSGVVEDDALGFGEWSVNDASGAVVLDDAGFNAIAAGLTTVGASVQVSGSVDYSFGEFKIQPRDVNDVLLFGCTSDAADNYDSSASVDDGSCEFSGTSCTLFFSEYSEGSSFNKYLELYNPTSSTIFLDQYAFSNVSNAPSTPGTHEYWNIFPSGATVAPNSTYIIAHPSADALILAVADMTHTYLSNGDDGYALVQGSEDDFIVIDVIGQSIYDEDYLDPGTGWEISGVLNATVNHTLVRKSDVNAGNAGMWAASAGTNEFDGEWIVNAQDDFTNLDSHVFTSGCAVNTGGCTDPGASNYDVAATTDDGSCVYIPNLTIQEIQSGLVTGQVLTSGVVTAVYDVENSLANSASFVIQNGTGPYSAIWCLGTGLVAGDLVEVSGSVSEVYGLRQILGAVATVVSSGNPVPAAELLTTGAVNDEQWESVLTQVLAPVSNADAGYGDWLLDDGSGNVKVATIADSYDAVSDSVLVDMEMTAVVELGVTYRVTGPNFFSYGSWKLLPVLATDVVRLGCMDVSFVNYDPLAEEDDGSCSNIPGCTDPTADNYDPAAVTDDGTCIVTGCFDTLALNYNANATVVDNTLCYYTLPSILINEIHYNPSLAQGDDFDWEFCELYNSGDLAADLSGYHFFNSASGNPQLGLVFPAGTSIAAGEFVIVTVAGGGGTLNYSGNGYQVFEMELGNFSNGGEAISLEDAWGNVVDAVTYASSGLWPGAGFSILGSTLIGNPNDGGASLEYIPEILATYNPEINSTDNAFGNNWQASWVDGGTPGAANSSAFGCNDAEACNYNPTAYLADNTSCTYDCYGCTYPDAENFTNGATLDDGTCTFAPAGSDCPADINNDGTITAADLLLFLSAFGQNC